jgi:hypothetical protein
LQTPISFVAKKSATIEIIAEVTGLPESKIKRILQKAGDE